MKRNYIFPAIHAIVMPKENVLQSASTPFTPGGETNTGNEPAYTPGRPA